MLSVKRYQKPLNRSAIKPQIVLKSKEQFGEILKKFFNIKKRDLLAENIYWHDLRTFYYGKLAFCKDNKADFVRKLHTDGVHLKYIQELADKYGVHHKTVRKKIKMLEDMGVILRGFDHKGRSVNHLILYVLKHTPFYYNPYGTTLKEIGELKNNTGYSYTEKKYGINRAEKIAKIRTLETTAIEGGGVRAETHTDNPREEISLKDISSFPVDSIKQNKKIFSVVKNECVETTQNNSSQQKSSLDDDFDATEENMERDWKQDYSDTALPEPPEYAVTGAGLVGGEFDYGYLSPDTPKPIETPLPQPTASVTPAKQIKQKLPEPTPAPIASDNDRTQSMSSMKDVLKSILEPTKEEQPMAIPQQKQDLRVKLSYQIYKSFPKLTAENIQDNLVITPIAPNKIGLKFNKSTPLKTDEKEMLRQCIKDVYGKTIIMISVNSKIPSKQATPTAQETQSRSVQLSPSTPAETKWNEMKNDILDSVYDNVKERMQFALNQVNVTSLEGRKLKLNAKALTCTKLSDNQSLIEKTADKYDIDIEVNNVTDHDVLYFPWVFDSAKLAPLALNLKGE